MSKVSCPECSYTWTDAGSLAVHRAKPHKRCFECGELRVGLAQHYSHAHSGTRRPKTPHGWKKGNTE